MIVCDNSSLFEINLGWELLVAASHHGGWERKARLPAGKQVSVFRLLPEAEAGAPGAPGGCPGGGARQGGLIFPVFALGTSKRSGAGTPAWSLPTPHTGRKLQKNGSPHPGHKCPRSQPSGWGRSPQNPRPCWDRPPQASAAMAGPSGIGGCRGGGAHGQVPFHSIRLGTLWTRAA